jgi:omega-amidase
MQLRISLIQMDVTIGRPDINYARAEQLIHQAAQRGTDLIILPEMWNTGYALKQMKEIADRDGKQTDALIGPLAKRYGVTIYAGSVADIREGLVYNTSYVYDHTGKRIASYSKLHLFRLMDEDQYLAAGEHIGQFQINGIDAGMIICYDLRFPELARTIALAGAKVLFIPAQWPHPRLNHWRQLQIARAIENQMFVVSCNRVGTSEGTTFFGHSMIIDPWGEILLEAGEEEGIFQETIDLDMVASVRAKIPVFEDRRPETYGR